MQLRNTEKQYGVLAIFLHWLMAVLLIVLIILGLYMVKLPISLQKLKLYGLHKEYGLLALWLVVLRYAWRITSKIPVLNLPRWEFLAARLVHAGFYVLMFALPLSGWCISSFAGLPVSFFGLFVMPDLVNPNEVWQHTFQLIHQWLAYGLIAFIFLHTAAALKHHFINKDDILRRML